MRRSLAPEGNVGDPGVGAANNALPVVRQLARDFPSVDFDLLVAFVAAHEGDEPGSDGEQLASLLMCQLNGQDSSRWRRGGGSGGEGGGRRSVRFIPVPECVTFQIERGGGSSGNNSGSASPLAAGCHRGGDILLADRIKSMLRDQLEDGEDSLSELEAQEAQDLRDQATVLHQRRLNLYRRAVEAHSRGGLTGTASAQYFASQGSLLKRQVERLNKGAAYLTFCSLY